MGEFELFTGKKRRYADSNEPTATVAKDRLYLNKIVREQYLNNPPAVEFLIDPEDCRVGLRPVDEDEDSEYAYSLHNRTLSAKNVWSKLGASVTETTAIPVNVEDEDFPVVDMSPFVDEEQATRVATESGTTNSNADEDGSASDERSASDDESDTEAAVEDFADSIKKRTDGPALEENRSNEPVAREDERDLDELSKVPGVGESKIGALRDDGFETLDDIRRAKVDDVAQKGVISMVYASRITDYATDVLDGGPSKSRSPAAGEDGDALLDHERIATALDSIGIDESVATGDVVVAVDDHDKTFEVAKELGINRADADDLVRRLSLKDALESNDGLAEERFDAGESGGVA